MALDGGTRPGDTLQILPLALAQPPNPRPITSHSVLRGHPSLTHRIEFFRGIQWGIHWQKKIIGTDFFFRKYAFQMKNIKHTRTHYYMYIYINLLYSLYVNSVIIICIMYAYSFIYMYIFFIRIHIYICVLKLQKNLKSIVNLSSLQ